MTATHKPTHHPCCNTLLRFASGTLSPAMNLLVASHLSYCPQCRMELQHYENAAGLGLESLSPEELDTTCLENLLARIDETGPPACIDVTLPAGDADDHRFPDTLRGYVGSGGRNIIWDNTASHAEWFLPFEHDRTTRLLNLKHGQNIGAIAFENYSVVMVLDGEIASGTRHYLRGDIMETQQLLSGKGNVTGTTLCLVVVQKKQDRLNWWQRLMAKLFDRR